MTVLTAETRLIGAGVALLPRVNLLPPEIAERRAFRRIQIGLGAAVLASVAVVGLLYVSSTQGVTSAQQELDTATAQQTTLTAQAAKFRNVTAVYAQAAAAQAQLTTALGDEVRYSQLLNDLSLSVPSNVWLRNVSYIQGASVGAPATVPVAGGVAPVGTFTVSGIGYSHDDVAAWLESIAGLKTYANPYFSTSTEALLGNTKAVVNFTTTADVTSKALSGRFTKPVGGK